MLVVGAGVVAIAHEAKTKIAFVADHVRGPLRSLRRTGVDGGSDKLEPRRSDEHRGDFCFQEGTEDVRDRLGCLRDYC